MVFERWIALLPVSKSVGGLFVHRDHKGDPNARMPFVPVPAAKQRAAVRLLVDQAFDEDAFRFDPTTLNKLAPNRWSHWGMGSLYSGPIEFPVAGLVEAVQTNLLVSLLHPIR
ncbi:MAG: hypothetical protein GWN54_07375, partial [Gammaproteobacteria bacterium]|nr:hypothetical protein [Gammaproteobacteria bacterium]